MPRADDDDDREEGGGSGMTRSKNMSRWTLLRSVMRPSSRSPGRSGLDSTWIQRPFDGDTL